MRENQMWIDIGPEKTALLKGYGFDVDGELRFVKHLLGAPWIVAFEHVSDTPLPRLRFANAPPSTKESNTVSSKVAREKWTYS
jgi:hypothetical protein